MNGMKNISVRATALIAEYVYHCHSSCVVARSTYEAAVAAPPTMIAERGPRRSTHFPTNGLHSPLRSSEIEKAKETSERDQPNSSSSGRT
jgi:ribulose-5-phosphate 4-epimerase/fuculose-1-phosphate aldolase